MNILESKYALRGNRDAEGNGTITLEWTNESGRKVTKPATPAEEHLTTQVNGLIAALQISMRRNAEYEKAAKEAS
jgi:hypothetical protein